MSDQLAKQPTRETHIRHMLEAATERDRLRWTTVSTNPTDDYSAYFLAKLGEHYQIEVRIYRDGSEACTIKRSDTFVMKWDSPAPRLGLTITDQLQRMADPVHVFMRALEEV